MQNRHGETPLNIRISMVLHKLLKMRPKEKNKIAMKIITTIERKPKHLYYVDYDGSIREYREERWSRFTFKEIFQCFWIEIKRGAGL